MTAALRQPELVVGDVAQAGVPLRAVPVEAEEVRRLHLERRVLRARGAVDERLVRVLLGVVGHGDRLVAGERADHDVGVELLHEPPGLLDRRVGAVVRAADPDDLDRVVADGAARHAVTRLVRVLRLGPGELREGRDDARQVLVVERAERALAVRQDADLDRRARAARCAARRPAAAAGSPPRRRPSARRRARRCCSTTSSLLLLSSLFEPQPATTNAANATRTARTSGPRFQPPPACISLPFPPPPEERQRWFSNPAGRVPPTTCVPHPAGVSSADPLRAGVVRPGRPELGDRAAPTGR